MSKTKFKYINRRNDIFAASNILMHGIFFPLITNVIY